MSQFSVRFFVDDRKLGEALRRLMGLAIGHPEVLPVTNASVSNGKMTAKTGGKASEQLADFLREKKPEQITAAVAREFFNSIGARSNPSGILRSLAEARVLKRVGKAGGPGHRATYRLAE